MTIKGNKPVRKPLFPRGHSQTKCAKTLDGPCHPAGCATESGEVSLTTATRKRPKPAIAPIAEGGASARALRLRQRLTLDRVAKLAGVSKGHLSRFERGEKALSVAALIRLAQALGTSVSVVLGETIDKDAIHLVRSKDRRVSRVSADEGGYRFALLSRSGKSGDLEIFTVELVAGMSLSGKVTHAGDESFFILDGEVEIEIGERLYHLRTGDYLEFPGNLRHSTRSRSGSATVLVIVRSRDL